MQLRALMFRLSFTYIYVLPGLKCDWPGEAVSRQALRTAVPIVLPPLGDASGSEEATASEASAAMGARAHNNLL